MGNTASVSTDTLQNFDYIPTFRKDEFLFSNSSLGRTDYISLETKMTEESNPSCSAIWAFATLIRFNFPGTSIPTPIEIRDKILRAKYGTKTDPIRYLTILDCFQNMDIFSALNDSSITQYFSIEPSNIIEELHNSHLICVGVPIYASFFKDELIRSIKKGDKFMGVVHGIIHGFCPHRNAYHIRLPFGSGYFSSGNIWMARDIAHRIFSEIWVLETIPIAKGAIGGKSIKTPVIEDDRTGTVTRIQRQIGVVS